MNVQKMFNLSLQKDILLYDKITINHQFCLNDLLQCLPRHPTSLCIQHR